MRHLYSLICLLVFVACAEKPKQEASIVIKEVATPSLSLEQAERLAQLPINCVNVEYPNKLNQTIGGDDDLQTSREQFLK